MITMGNKALLSVIACGVLFSSNLYAQNDENMVKSIMTLRGDVESLYTKIDENKDYFRSQMKSLSMQSTDNEAQINRQETSLKLTEQNIDKVEDQLNEIGNKGQDIKPMIYDALLTLSSQIKAGIPFKVEDRLAALSKIKTDLNNGDITQEKALALTWASYDDALRLTKEIGLFKQEITIDNEEKLAKIAKIGSVMMFFSTLDDQVGYVKQKGDVYQYVTVADEVQRTQIVNLFDALQKQIRTGYFTLPNALLLRGVN
ncbi:DUF3450 family protein [Sulfurovum sp.]|uniref:DUF3450 family protein n=1 Tax=Sulfurovum sp. TaxID=1969726 RepID=UPI0035622FCF